MAKAKNKSLRATARNNIDQTPTMLIDTSAMIALISDKDQSHSQAIAIMASLPQGTFITTTFCFTEAANHLSYDYGTHQLQKLLQMESDNTIAVCHPTPDKMRRIQDLTLKYNDTPMSLADASLIAAAESLQAHHIFTFDSDFEIYRINNTQPVEIIPADQPRRRRRETRPRLRRNHQIKRQPHRQSF